MFRTRRSARKAVIVTFTVAFLLFANTVGIAIAQEQKDTEAPATPEAVEVHDGTRADPIPRGQSAEVGDWEVKIVGWKRNATADVMAENRFNSSPEDGVQFAIVTLQIKYVGDETGGPYDLRVKAVGERNVGYDSGDCGVIPNPYYDISDVFPGGEVKANWCFAIHSSDAASLLVYIESTWDFNSKPVFFDPVKPQD